MFSRFTFTSAAIASLLGLWPLASAPAAAQSQSGQTSGNVRVVPVSAGERELDNLGEVFINAQDCADDVEITFRLDGIPTDKATIDVYRGTNCSDATRDNTDMTNCTFLFSEPPGDAIENFELTFSASQLMCEQGVRQEPNLWFLPVDNSQSGEEVGQVHGQFQFVLDADPPSAPSDVTGGSGESQIPVTWETNATEIERFIVYVDSAGGAGDGGACASEVLVAGEAASSVPTTVRKKTVNQGSARRATLSSSDVDGAFAAVAVVAEDEAGNQSVLSDIACISVVPTDGFWDRYEQEDGAVEPGCPCAAMGPVHAEAAWPVAMSVLALTLRRRRPRRRDRRQP